MIAQFMIGLCGVTAIWLSQSADHDRRRYACLFGLAAQPFWFYTTWHAEQWGIFALCFLYTWSWWRGFRFYWRGFGTNERANEKSRQP